MALNMKSRDALRTETRSAVVASLAQHHNFVWVAAKNLRVNVW